MSTDTVCSRRTILARLAAPAATVWLLGADPLKLPIGCQLYPVRDLLGKDFEGTLRQIAAIGYKSVEMCSPQGYTNSGFSTLANRKASQIRSTIRAAGLACESCHYNYRELKESLEERIDYAKQLGLKQMILASFGLPADATLAEWERAAAELNIIGERVRKSGLQLGYHNHNREFEKVDGVLVYDRLMAEFDPKLVKMQFQTAVISLGYDAVPYFEKFPGRFLSMHLADWSASEKKTMPVGGGVIDWKRLFGAARNAGIRNYFVEVDLDAMKASYPYLHQLQA